MIVEHLEVGPLQSNCYILSDDRESEAIVIDPGGDGNRILALLKRKSWKVKMVLNTHAHFDHIAANAEVVNATEASLAVPRLDAQMMGHSVMQAQMYGLSVDPSPKPDILLEDGDTIELGDEMIEVLATPGHSPGGVSFKTSVGIFPGDTLFAGSIGRTDLPGGDFDTLINSIKEKILVLPEDTDVFPGHGPSTTVGREKMHNPFLQG